jgi:hypothetical protein
MSTILLQLLGLTGSAARNLVPGWATVKMVARVVIASALVAGGMVIGAWAHSWGEARRIARERATAVELANAKGAADAMTAAVRLQADTLEKRRRALEASEIHISTLEKALEDARNASPNPDAVVVPAGDPWLRGRR